MPSRSSCSRTNCRAVDAVRVKVAGQTGAFYYFYTDRQGSVHALRKADGTWVNGNYARYDAYGGYRTKPATTVNPGISDRGYTGHRMNNTGNDLGLIYKQSKIANARYYLPEVGRFISADTIVPDPKDPQTYNRYSYALNSPTNYTDPTGHCTSNYEAGSQEMETCLSAWNSVSNYLVGAAFGPGGSGHFPNELISDWLANVDIGTLENLMQSYGIDYGYTYAPPGGISGLTLPISRAEDVTCQYWQSCYEPVVTREEMWPDAIALGGSSSAAGILYGVIGEERVINFRTGERSLYAYHGQGAGVALEADKSGYLAVIWNLEKNIDYEGISPTLAVDLGLGIHGQVALFWEAGTVPFTGDTWGIAFVSGAGGGFAITGSYTHYTCLSTCR